MPRFRAPTSRFTLCLAALLAAAAVLPAAASAHAQLEATSPQRDSVVKHEPSFVSFRFDETVSTDAGSVRVFDSTGKRVDDGNARHPGGKGPTVGVGLKPGLPNGTYTATYRVVSADTHVVTGGFVFSIGSRGAGAGKSVGKLLADQKTGSITGTAFSIVRAIQFASIGIGAGLLLFLVLVWQRVLAGGEEWRDASSAFGRRQARAVLWVSITGFVSAVCGVVLQAAEASGVTFWKAISGSVLSPVIHTRFGAVWTVGAVLWLIIMAGAAVSLRGRTPVRLLGLPLLALILLPALAGHPSVQHPVWLFLPMNLIHVTAMSLWLGGLTALLVALPAATAAVGPVDRTRMLAGVLERFSPLALGAVIALLTTGVVQALLQIDAWSELLHTGYGRAVLIKFCLLLGLIGLGAVNRQRTVPELRRLATDGATPGRTGILLRRTLRSEVAVIAVVLVATGALAGAAPAKDADTGPVSITSHIGPAQLSLDVDPAQVGANTIHIYLLNPKSGAQYDKAKEFTVNATEDAKGISLPLTVAHTGPGHYTIQSAVLSTPGTWTLHLTARVSDFDEFQRNVKVRIR